MKTRKLTAGMLAAVLTFVLLTAAVIPAVAAGATISPEEISSIVNSVTDQTLVSSPFTEAVSRVRSSIVGVNNYQKISGSYFGYGFGNDFGFDGGRQQEETERLVGTGSGVVISAYGHVLTNYHVVENASFVKVSDGEKEYDATVVGSDSVLDIAVLQVNGLSISPAPLGDSDALQVGEWAIVIGNPLGEDFARTVTVGVVSALDREVKDSSFDRYGRRTTITNTMIQVDAAINSGNSGGGMFNILGQLQGIPARKYSGGTFSATTIDNIGMSIPINAAKPLIESVLSSYDAAAASADPSAGSASGSQSGDVAKVRPRIGVTVTTISSTDSAVAQGILPLGAYVTNVESGSPAEKAGVQKGDIIVDINGTVIKSSTEMVSTLQNYKEGDILAIKIYRAENIAGAQSIEEIGEGKYLDLSVELLIIDEIGM